MKKIFDKKLIQEHFYKLKYKDVLIELQDYVFLTKYEKDEFVTGPFDKEQLFQIVVDGTLNIYFVRDDGTSYYLATGQSDYLLGDMDLFTNRNHSIFAEANEPLTCIAMSIDSNREQLLSNINFLKLIAGSLTYKMQTIAETDAAPSTLKERIITYMRFKCERETMKGLEQAAFHLHCSARQLQRIMNEFESEGIVKKIGKGSYQLIHDNAKTS